MDPLERLTELLRSSIDAQHQGMELALAAGQETVQAVLKAGRVPFWVKSALALRAGVPLPGWCRMWLPFNMADLPLLELRQDIQNLSLNSGLSPYNGTPITLRLSSATKNVSVERIELQDLWAPGLRKLSMQWGLLPAGSVQGLQTLKVHDVRGLQRFLKQLNSSLRHLEVVCCPQLTSLCLYRYPALKTLMVDKCALRQPPEGLTGLLSLESLNFSNNPLTHLPPDLGRLSQLRQLSLSSTRLTQLPESMGSLCALRSLKLAATSLKQLPASMTGLLALETLTVAHSPLSALPHLPGLRTLDIRRTAIQYLPNEHWAELLSLRVAGTPLKGLPPPHQLPKLRNLLVSSDQMAAMKSWAADHPTAQVQHAR